MFDRNAILVHYQKMNKRIVVLILSISSITCYGYALGGLGAHIMGGGDMYVIAAGLIGGTFCAWLALKLWRQFLDEHSEEAETKAPGKNSRDETDSTDSL